MHECDGPLLIDQVTPAVLAGGCTPLDQIDNLRGSERRIESEQLGCQVDNIRRRHGSSRQLELRTTGNITLNVVSVGIHDNSVAVTRERSFVPCLIDCAYCD